MAKAKQTTPDEKQFSLKAVELQMVQNIHERANSALFDMFSFIALERLAYTPTKGTQFRVENGNLFISESEDKDAEVAVA